MKKKLILSAFILIVVTLTVILLGQSNERVIYSSKIKEIPTTDTLAMMYETESGSGEYIVSDDTSWPLEGYTFNAELSRCENGSKLYWDEETKSVMMEANVSDKCYVYFDVEPITLSNYIMNNVYTGTDGENGLYYHDGSGSYTNADQEAGDNSYRYSGANPNNYVCFGSDEKVCPDDNLYRIIGVFDGQVKLIKNTSIGNYAWGSARNNTWNSSTKPYIENILNSTFWETLNSTWQNKIANTAWKVGGVYFGVYNVRQFYNSELGNNSGNIIDNLNVGLMYVSDYGYGASPDSWTTELNLTNEAQNNNWIYMGKREWTITRDTEDVTDAFFVDYNVSSISVLEEYAVRPVFYLHPWVLYSSGDGTQENPYRIS